MPKQQYFLIIDGHALIYRAFHAFPALTNHEGKLVNAVFGFSRHILSAIREYHPEYIVVAFDHKAPTFRHADFADYKANRAKMPDELIGQIDMIKEIVKVLNIPQFEVAGYEADDLNGTVTRQIEETCSDQNLTTLIVTGDRDAFQLVSDCTHVWLPGRGKGQVDTEYDRNGVKERMDVYPEQIVDLKALMGDASDNIPGVPGVGEKTATALITEFGNLEKLYEAIDALDKQPAAPGSALQKKSLVEKLKAGKESAFMSQKLATIDRHAPVELKLADCRMAAYDKKAAVELFTNLDFKSLINSLPADEFELSVQGALF